MTPPRLLAISDRRALGAVTLEAWGAALVGARVPAIQLREKDLADGALLRAARTLRSAFPAPGLLLINGRADLALAAEADGVHLPADGLPAAAVRRVAPRLGLIGRSTHDLEDVRRARDEGVDYVLFGPVWATPAKAGTLPARGISSLVRAVRVGVPVLALGGVENADRAAAAMAAGAHGVAGIRAFLDAARASAIVAAVGHAGGAQT